jgi:D-cysteine desulfhydrase
MAGLIDLVRTGRLHDAKDVVFMHTGGSPAMFAYSDALTASAGAP